MTAPFHHITIPPVIQSALQQGATLAVNISGGKDSQAMLNELVLARHRLPQYGWAGARFAIHAHLGRAEWPQTLVHCHQMTDLVNTPFVVVRREKGDLVARIQERQAQLAGTGKPFWPSAMARYCTSDLKKNPIDRYLRRYSGIVISAIGIRAQESSRRAQKPVVAINKAITAKSLQGLSPEDALALRSFKQRLGLIWHPLLEWDIAAVWRACGTSKEEIAWRREMYQAGRQTKNAALQATAVADWPCHVAYVYGCTRLSCALCVLASHNDLEVGLTHNLELAHTYITMEEESGFSFQPNRSLGNIATCDW